MEIFISSLIGFLLGLLGSFIFLRWQLSIKPIVSISSYIIYSSEKCTFRAKIANETNRQVTDIRVKLNIMKRIKYKTHTVQLLVRHLNLQSEEALILAGRKERVKPWGILYARTFETTPDNEALKLLSSSISGEERRLVLTMEAVDALSGTKIVQRKTYRYEDVVLDAKFGEKFTIIKSDQQLLAELLKI